MDAKTHDDLEKLLKDAVGTWGDEVDGPEAWKLVKDSLDFINEQFELMAQLVERLDSERAQREFYSQVLVAITKYRGSDPTQMPLMALAAIADVLPPPPKDDDGG